MAIKILATVAVTIVIVGIFLAIFLPKKTKANTPYRMEVVQDEHHGVLTVFAFYHDKVTGDEIGCYIYGGKPACWKTGRTWK